MIKLLFSLLLLTLSGCANSQLDEWRVSTLAPQHYPAETDTLLIFSEKFSENIRNNKQGGWSGMVTRATPESNNPLGWDGRERHHSGYTISSVDLPGSVYISWYSLANKRAYEKKIRISDEIRASMREYHDIRCGFNNSLHPYKDNILLGLAPDGMISVFLNGTCIDNELQFKVQAVDEKIPDGYVFPELDEEDQAYVDIHGVPAGSW